MKNKYKIIVILFSIIIMLYLISNTLADYVSTGNGKIDANLAKWNVEVGGVNVSSEENHEILTEVEFIPEEVDGVMAGKIAPESKMVGTFTIDPLDTEVDIEYEVTVGEFFCIEESTYTPDIQITAVTINDNTVTLDSSGKFSGKINIGGNVATIKIYAYWSSSEEDYLIGNNITQVGLPINVSIEQSAKKWQRILDLFKIGKLAIGDWVTYDAGTWTQEEIASIEVGPNVKASGSNSRPSTNFQFGGFTAGMSRNVGAIEYNNGTYMYAKMYDDGDTSNKVAISGWRVWDIDETKGEIVLISAANPEDYYHGYDANEQFAYTAQYIFTGTKASSWNEKDIAEEKYKIRNWDMYKNSNYGAISARPITFTDLKNWYSKYTGGTSLVYGDTASFGKIYNPYSSYQNLVDNHSYYWLSVAFNAAGVYCVTPGNRYVSNSTICAFGVRVLVSIPLESYVKNEPIAERTVTEDGMAYNGGTWGAETVQDYNVWELR